MPIKKELLDILCCPKTKVPVKLLSKEQIESVNRSINNKDVLYADGTKVDQPLKEGLITEDLKTIYKIEDNIPIMLIDKGIPTGSIKDL